MLLSSGTITSDRAYIGILLGIGSAVAYAVYFLWVEHTKLADMDTTVFVTLKTCVSTVLFLLYILIYIIYLYISLIKLEKMKRSSKNETRK